MEQLTNTDGETAVWTAVHTSIIAPHLTVDHISQ